MRQKTELEITLHAGTTGEAPSADAEGTEARAAKTELESRAAVGPSMEAIVERVNLKKALARVKRNKGASGLDVVVDIDLEKFFDRVNHDILMGLVAKRVTDKRVLKLIRGFLTTGGLADGLVGPTEEGTPQGGPLSPLLSNLMLDVLDKELE